MTVPRTIGVLIGYPVYESNTINEYVHSVFAGIAAAAQVYHCNVLIAGGLNPAIPGTRTLPAWPLWTANTTFVPIGPWNTDGLIVIPPLSSACSDYVDDLCVDGFPLVFTEVDKRGPSVVTDNAHGIFRAVEHLWEHGHRHIAFVAGFENLIGDSSIRLEAFRAALRTCNTEPDSELIAYSQHTVDGGRRAMEQLLHRKHPFTAVIASNLHSAIGAMHVLRAAGHRIPDDVAFIAVDDHVDAEAQVPPLTTVHLQTFEQGYQAVRVMLEHIDGKYDSATTVSIPTHLVLRRSCGCQFSSRESSPRMLHRVGADLTRTAVVQRMTEATRAKAYRLKYDDLADRFQQLIDAFDQSLMQMHDVPFLNALATLLTYSDTARENPGVFQDALSVLAQDITAINTAADPQQTLWAYELIDKARVAINERARHHIAQERVEQATIADRLGAMTAQLLATLDVAEILRSIRAYLPEIGIQYAQIAMLEAEDDDPVAWSTLWLHDPDTNEINQRRMRTSTFPSPDMYGSDAPFQLILVPLLSQETQIGYMVYDVGRVEVCGAITRHIAAALINCTLYRAAADGRRLAEEANQLKTRFLSMVSHELRTPLSVIVGLSELALREQREGKSTTLQDLERIYSSAHHLGSLIHDVLDLASSQAGQLRLTRETLDIVEALQSVIVTGAQLAYDKGLAWRVTLPEKRPTVLGDRTRLRQVALNLIANAVKFTARGSVAFSIEAGDGYVAVTVRDTGVGIPLAEQSLIFDEFHQSERTATRGYGGLGLGLAISRSLIAAHGGTIEVHSSGVEGAGTTFSFTLPTLAQRPMTATSLASPSHIVVLAEHATTAAQVGDFLRDHDLPRVFQPHAISAPWREEIATLPPDMLLVESGAIDHWEIIRSLQEHPITQHIPVVFYTLRTAASGTALDLEYHQVALTLHQLAQMLERTATIITLSATILLVDDDASILELHTRLLQSALPDSHVLSARNGREALAIAQHTRPDLILLDLMMPELDGFETLAALRASDATRDIPVIVLSDMALTAEEMVQLKDSVVVLEKGVITTEEILSHVTQALRHARRAGGSTQHLVRRAVAFIHAHYADSLTREDIARYLSVSENYLTNCFQRELGISPLTFLNRYRVKQARALLEHSDNNVTTIALAVGFADSGYFSRIFQREIGMSPSAYRRSYGKR